MPINCICLAFSIRERDFSFCCSGWFGVIFSLSLYLSTPISVRSQPSNFESWKMLLFMPLFRLFVFVGLYNISMKIYFCLVSWSHGTQTFNRERKSEREKECAQWYRDKFSVVVFDCVFNTSSHLNLNLTWRWWWKKKLCSLRVPDFTFSVWRKQIATAQIDCRCYFFFIFPFCRCFFFLLSSVRTVHASSQLHECKTAKINGIKFNVSITKNR